jgi:hypothetical protein
MAELAVHGAVAGLVAVVRFLGAFSSIGVVL